MSNEKWKMLPLWLSFRMMRELFLFNLANFFNASLMSAAGKFCLEPGAHNFRQFLRGRYACAERKHICVVVLTRETSRLFVPVHRRAHAGNFIGRDGHPRA